MTATTTPPAAADPYSSRVSPQWEAVPRQDPVVWPGQPGPLNPEQLEAYARDGYYFAPALLPSDEASGLLDEAARLADAARPRDEGVVFEPGSETRVRSVFRVHRDNARYRAACAGAGIAQIARQLLGGDVYIHQSRINYKPPLDGKEFFWHSDFETWHIEDGMPRMRAVSVSLFLTDSNEFNGPLMVIPGSHQLYVRCVGETPEQHYEQSLRKQQYGVPDREALELLVERGGIAAPKGPAGSALFFDCNLMHGSVGNLSPWPRTNLFAVYNSVSNRLVDPFGGLPPRPDYLAERGVPRTLQPEGAER